MICMLLDRSLNTSSFLLNFYRMSLLRYFKASSDTTKFPDSRSPLSIDQLRRERLSHEYHYPPFWWSKLPAVIVRCVLDNEANDIETH